MKIIQEIILLYCELSRLMHDVGGQIASVTNRLNCA